MDDFQSAGDGDQQESAEFGSHQRAGVDLVIARKVRQREGFENPQGIGEFVDLPRLASGEVGGLQAAGVVFPLRLAAGIGGGGMGLACGSRKALEIGAELGADSV